MRVMKSSSLLMLMMLMVWTVPARALVDLPQSSHYEGITSFDIVEHNVSGLVRFAVYDTQTYPNEFTGSDGFTNPGSGRYIYAYQVFNSALSEAGIDGFSVFGLTDYSMDVDEESIEGQDPGEGQVEPTDSFFTESNKKGVWTFEGDGFAILEGDSSWFLAFSSDQDWVKGDYEITIADDDDDDFPVPPEIPEPATISLLGLGVLALLRKRKKVA